MNEGMNEGSPESSISKRTSMTLKAEYTVPLPPPLVLRAHLCTLSVELNTEELATHLIKVHGIFDVQHMLNNVERTKAAKKHGKMMHEERKPRTFLSRIARGFDGKVRQYSLA